MQCAFCSPVLHVYSLTNDIYKGSVSLNCSVRMKSNCIFNCKGGHDWLRNTVFSEIMNQFIRWWYTETNMHSIEDINMNSGINNAAI